MRRGDFTTRQVVIWVVVLFMLLAGFYLTVNHFRQEASQETSAEDFMEDLLREDVPEEHLEEAALLFEVMEILENEYVEPVDKDELIKGAVQGMVESLGDPQTRYLNEDDLQELFIETEGVFGGIGVRITEVEGRVTVIEVLPDTPSQEMGLERGDRIWKVDGEELEEHTIDEAVDLLRGEAGTEVQVTVKRPGTPDKLDFDLVREDIQTSTVDYGWIEEGIGYLEISSFDRRTGQEVKDALNALEDEGLEGLVLDLRYNPGGLLDQALDVADIFLSEGEITSLVGRDDVMLRTYEAKGDPKPYPLTVLINKDSASGAEIVAGALQDHGKAKLVGESTYGKATVQEVEDRLSEGGLRYTIARYITPKGKDLHEEGLTPDHIVEPSRVFSYYRYFIPETLEKGDRGEAVLMLQEMLDVLGHETELTSEFDHQTEAALQEFQRDQGLDVQGVFDDVTWLSLREKIDDRVMDEDPQILKALEILKKR